MQSHQRQQILDVATELFFESGFWNAKISEIAARSEISTASIYKVFESKESLFRAVLAHGIGRLKQMAKPLPEGEDPRSQLLHASDRYQCLCSSPLLRDLVRVPIEHNAIPMNFRRTMCRQIRTALEQLCLPPLRACAEAGLIDPDRIHEAFRLLSAYIEHQTIWYGLLMSPGSKPVMQGEHIAEEAVRITLLAYSQASVACVSPSVSDDQSDLARQLRPSPGPTD